MADDAVVRGRADARGARVGAYGIDGGNVALPVFGLLEAGLVGAAVGMLRRPRYWLALLAGSVGFAVAGSAGSYLYSSLHGKVRGMG